MLRDARAIATEPAPSFDEEPSPDTERGATPDTLRCPVFEIRTGQRRDAIAPPPMPEIPRHDRVPAIDRPGLAKCGPAPRLTRIATPAELAREAGVSVWTMRRRLRAWALEEQMRTGYPPPWLAREPHGKAPAHMKVSKDLLREAKPASFSHTFARVEDVAQVASEVQTLRKEQRAIRCKLRTIAHR